MNSGFRFAVTLALVLAPKGLFAAGPEQWAVGSSYPIEIEKLHPTQFRVGQDEVNDKRENFEKMSPKGLRKYLEANPCPVVLGPGDIPYITDEQHRANSAEGAENSHRAIRALRDHGEPVMYMKVIADFRNMSPTEFEKAMVENHYTYLNDLGKPRPFNELPAHVSDMKDDPYRSLAGFTENTAWYEKPGVFFIQFVVAEWLRPHLGMPDDKVHSELEHHKRRKQLLDKVSDLLKSSAAASEPWYWKCAENLSAPKAKAK